MWLWIVYFGIAVVLWVPFARKTAKGVAWYPLNDPQPDKEDLAIGVIVGLVGACLWPIVIPAAYVSKVVQRQVEEETERKRAARDAERESYYKKFH